MLFYYRPLVEKHIEKRRKWMKDSKSTQERQKEIVEAAKKLFFSKGYEATSTVDIMKAVGIAKGTLYYHFSSKEEILDALIEDITDQMVIRAQKVQDNKTLSVINRMVGIIAAISFDDDEETAVIDVLHLPQNAQFHQKSYKLMIEKISPIMLSAVEEGIEEEIFHTDYPQAAVHMAMTYSLTTFDSEQIDIDLIKGFIYNLERILGTDAGTLNQFMDLFKQ